MASGRSHGRSRSLMDSMSTEHSQLQECRRRSPWPAISLILVIEMCERLTYYTLQGTIRNFLLDNGYGMKQASSLTASFNTVGWLCCLPGGVAADTFGLYGTIFVSALVYVLGSGLLVVAALPSVSSPALFLLCSMIFVSAGMGGIKPNIMNFGANQISTPGEAGKAQKRSYFSWFYLMVNVGCFPAFAYLVTLATSGQPPAIPKQYGFAAAYGVAAASMLLAALLYLCGSPLYAKARGSGGSEGPLGALVRALWSTARGRGAAAVRAMRER